MSYQAIFKRYEQKYLLTQEQKQAVLAAMANYMALDRYGRSTVRNLYYDTPTYRLIRRSLEKPVYKEKLRLRSYHTAGEDTPVFVELKKKYKGVVYKRRLVLPCQIAMTCLAGEAPIPVDTQIAREIAYFRDFYKELKPVVFLSYEREAYCCKEGSDFRVTFDDHILFRRDRLSLREEPGGTALLPPGTVLMEIKTSGGIPLWMTRVLTQERIFKTSFSKYGTAYSNDIQTIGDVQNA